MKENKFQIETNPIEIRSEEVQEIISHVPNRIIRWGITVIFVALLTILFISWFIKYPDILSANVIITTSPAPVTIVTRSSGSLFLLKQEGEQVTPGELVGFIKSTASFKDVLALENSILNNFPYEDSSRTLGDLEPDYSRLLTDISAIKTFNGSQAFDKQIDQLKKQEITYKKLDKSLRAQYKLSIQELVLAKQKFKTDSILYLQKVTADLDFNQAKTTLLQQVRANKNFEMAVLNNELQLNQVSKQISDLELQKFEQEQKLNLAAENSRKQLIASILKWKQAYLFTASDTGKVAWIGVQENDKFTEVGKPVASVIPEKGRLIAYAELPLKGSGKVKQGQRVNIKLENYPFEQFGVISGKIMVISQTTDESKYFVSIELQDGLKTNLSQTLPFKQQLAGTTEIITEDLRLLEKVFYHFKSLNSQFD